MKKTATDSSASVADTVVTVLPIDSMTINNSKVVEVFRRGLY
jgi:hypothetical protein